MLACPLLSFRHHTLCNQGVALAEIGAGLYFQVPYSLYRTLIIEFRNGLQNANEP